MGNHQHRPCICPRCCRNINAGVSQQQGPPLGPKVKGPNVFRNICMAPVCRKNWTETANGELWQTSPFNSPCEGCCSGSFPAARWLTPFTDAKLHKSDRCLTSGDLSPHIPSAPAPIVMQPLKTLKAQTSLTYSELLNLALSLDA